MYNKAQLNKDRKDAKKPRSLAKPKDIDYVSKMGYRDDSPFNNRSYIDINTPNGSIDMSNTGIDLIANGRFLPAYSGLHQFDTTTVREIPAAENGGEYMDLTEDEIAEYRRGGYVVEELPKAQTGVSTGPSPQDYMDVYNNSLEIQNYINNQAGYFRNSGEDAFNKMYSTPEQKWAKLAEEAARIQSGERVPTGIFINNQLVPDYQFKASDYYQPIDENKFKQREVANGILNYDIPMALYDKRIPIDHFLKYESDPGHAIKWDSFTAPTYNLVKLKEEMAKQYPEVVYDDQGRAYIKPKEEETPPVEVVPKEPEMVWIRQKVAPEKNMFGKPKKGQESSWVEKQVLAGSDEANRWFAANQHSPDSIAYFKDYPMYDASGNKVFNNIISSEYTEIPKYRQFDTEGAFPYGYAPSTTTPEQLATEVETGIRKEGGYVSKQMVHFLTGGSYDEPLPKAQKGDQIYTYVDRPEAKYKKDAKGNWLISLPSTKGKFVPLNDPTGKRTQALIAGLESGSTRPYQTKSDLKYNSLIDTVNRGTQPESTNVVSLNTLRTFNPLKVDYSVQYNQRVADQNKLVQAYNPKKPYAIVDKNADSIFYFNPNGTPIKGESIITGASNNDIDRGLSMKEWMEKTGNESHDAYFNYLKSIKAQTTPSGAYTLGNLRTNTAQDPSLIGRTVNNLFRPERAEFIRNSRISDYGPQQKMFTLIDSHGEGSSKAIHGTGNPERIEAFNTPGANRAMSNGCINVNGQTVCFDVLRKGSGMYILPEQSNGLVAPNSFFMPRTNKEGKPTIFQKGGGSASKPANRWAVTDPRSMQVDNYFPKLAEGGSSSQLYIHPDRMDAVYKKDSKGKWLIKSDDTNGKFVSLKDPDGKRAANLNKYAVPAKKAGTTPAADRHVVGATPYTYLNSRDVPDSPGEDIGEIFDPTGISSWDDIARSYSREGMSPNTALEIFGAIPLLGKAKYIGEMVQSLGKTFAATARQKRNARDFGNMMRAVGTYGPGLGTGADVYQAYRNNFTNNSLGPRYQDGGNTDPGNNALELHMFYDKDVYKQDGGEIGYLTDQEIADLRKQGFRVDVE